MHIHLPDKAPVLLSGPHLVAMTDEEFFDFCQQNPNLRIERTANHEIVMMSPTGSRSGQRNTHPVQPEPEIVQGFGQELSGETVQPGFRLRLAELR